MNDYEPIGKHYTRANRVQKAVMVIAVLAAVAAWVTHEWKAWEVDRVIDEALRLVETEQQRLDRRESELDAREAVLNSIDIFYEGGNVIYASPGIACECADDQASSRGRRRASRA